jgi:hypothetical protein
MAVVSSIELEPTSLIESYDSSTGQWFHQTLENIHLVGNERRLLYKVRRSLEEGMDDSECPGLQAKIAWVTYGAQGYLESAKDTHMMTTIFDDELGGPALSDAVDEAELVSGEYTVPDDFYQYISLPDEAPVGASSTQPACSMNVDHAASCQDLRQHPQSRHWPDDFTVLEITRGFEQMRHYESIYCRDVRCEAFQLVFGCKFNPRDFQRHFDTLQSASQNLREHFEQMGDDENALWGRFELAVQLQQA